MKIDDKDSEYTIPPMTLFDVINSDLDVPDRSTPFLKAINFMSKVELLQDNKELCEKIKENLMLELNDIYAFDDIVSSNIMSVSIDGNRRYVFEMEYKQFTYQILDDRLDEFIGSEDYQMVLNLIGFMFKNNIGYETLPF